jgi:hypothetical protein
MSWDDWDVGPYNLQFQPGDAMPSLEELALPSAGYYLSADHCQRWKACMDWTQLRVLELKNAPRHLLAALTGSVPELRCLRFHMARDYWMRGMNDEVDLGVVSRFLSSISGLEEVDVQESGTAAFPKIWAGFIERHGHSLRKLSVRHHAKNYIYPSDIAAWSTSDFARLLEETPRLESLAKDAELEQDPGTEQRSLVWVCGDVSTSREMAQMLICCVAAAIYNCSFSPVPAPTLSASYLSAQRALSRLLLTLSSHGIHQRARSTGSCHQPLQRIHAS